MESSTATGGTATATRPKAIPDFRVFRETDDGTWENLTEKEPVQAPNKKAAIRAAAGDEAEGTFMAIRDKEYNPLTRKVQEVKVVTKAQETWN